MEQKVEKQASLESVPVKRLKRELKYQGTILKMYEDTVEVNGHQAKWDFIHHDGAASGASGYGGWKDSHGASVPQCAGPLYTGDSGW